MKIGIIGGTGGMGKGFALRFCKKHAVIIGSRDAERAKTAANEYSGLAKDAYGEYDEKAIQILPREQFAGIELIKGMPLYGQGEDGGTVQVAVKILTDDKVTIDFNHPLAGKELAFAVSVSMVRDASADELSSGIPAENAQPEDESCGTGCGCH